MLRHITAIALCVSMSVSLAISDAYSGTDHNAIEYERQACIDRDGTFDYPTCILPEQDSNEQQSESSSGSGVITAIIVGTFAYIVCRAAGGCGQKK